MGLRYAGGVAIRQPSAQATVPDPFIELLAFARANDFDLPTDEAVELARSLSYALHGALLTPNDFDLTIGPDGTFEFNSCIRDLILAIEIPPEGEDFGYVVANVTTRAVVAHGSAASQSALIQQLRLAIG